MIEERHFRNLSHFAQAYVEERCAAVQSLEYWTFGGLDHGTIVRPGTRLEDPLMTWTKSRFSSEPSPSGCARQFFLSPPP